MKARSIGAMVEEEKDNGGSFLGNTGAGTGDEGGCISRCKLEKRTAI